MIYSEATDALRALRRGDRHPGGRDPGRQAARCAWDHPLCLGAVGATGTPAANRARRRGGPRDRHRHAVQRLHDRLEDGASRTRTSASSTSTSPPSTPTSTAALPVVADAREALDGPARGARRPPRAGRAGAAREKSAGWATGTAAVEAAPRRRAAALPGQAEIIGAVNDAAGRRGVVVCAAGLAARRPAQAVARAGPGQGYHVEYGYSCMGYEIAGGIGVKLAAPDREVFVMVGDGSYLMLPSELVTAVAGGHQARSSSSSTTTATPRSGRCRETVGSGRFGTHYRAASGALPATMPRDALAEPRRRGRLRGQRREPRRATPSDAQRERGAPAAAEAAAATARSWSRRVRPRARVPSYEVVGRARRRGERR